MTSGMFAGLEEKVHTYSWTNRNRNIIKAFGLACTHASSPTMMVAMPMSDELKGPGDERRRRK